MQRRNFLAFGVGGMAAVAAPAIVRAQGSGVVNL